MEKRYYYTNTLAAAWMAKHFGMKFIIRDGVYVPTWQELASSGNADGYFIHPDSLHLLELRVGDVLYSKVGHGISIEELISEERASLTAPYIVRRGGRIIQRDGKPFFWPECEE